MTTTERPITGILKDVFEITVTRQVVVIVEDIDGDIPVSAVLRAGDLVSEITGIDYPRTIVDLPDGSRGLDFSMLGLALKSGTKADWLFHRGQTVSIIVKNS